MDRFVILDDDTDMGEHITRLVITDTENGMNEKHAKEIISEIIAKGTEGGTVVIEVTTRTTYIIPRAAFLSTGYTTVKQLVKGWFKDFNINRYHSGDTRFLHGNTC